MPKNKAFALTDEERDSLLRIRMRGFAVVVFNHEELGKVEADDLEGYLTEKGNTFLQLYNEE